MRTKTRRALRRRALACLFVAMLVLAVGMESAVYELASAARYHSLVSDDDVVESASGASEDGGAPRWEDLLAQNEDVIGLLSVAGTGIRYPVVKPQGNKAADYYLSHDFWGNRNALGCPFADTRAPAAWQHLIVYAHRAQAPGVMFHDIARADTPQVFAQIGTLTWEDANGSTQTFEALCSLCVERTFAAIQTFSWESAGALQRWLDALLKETSAQNPCAKQLCEKATRVVTLVTCTRSSAPQLRTLVVFVATSAAN